MCTIKSRHFLRMLRSFVLQIVQIIQVILVPSFLAASFKVGGLTSFASKHLQANACEHLQANASKCKHRHKPSSCQALASEHFQVGTCEDTRKRKVITICHPSNYCFDNCTCIALHQQLLQTFCGKHASHKVFDTALDVDIHLKMNAFRKENFGQRRLRGLGGGLCEAGKGVINVLSPSIATSRQCHNNLKTTQYFRNLFSREVKVHSIQSINISIKSWWHE